MTGRRLRAVAAPRNGHDPPNPTLMERRSWPVEISILSTVGGDMKTLNTVCRSTAVCVVACLSIGVADAVGGQTDKLLDEVIAGIEANASLIVNGTAQYSVTTTTLLPAERPGLPVERTQSENVTVYFSGRRTRFDSETMRTIVDDERFIDFDATDLGTPRQRQPHNYSAVIQVRAAARPLKVHPRMLGLGEMDTLADMIRACRKRQGCQLEAVKDASTIKITLRSDSAYAKDEFIVAPEQGYGAISRRMWSLKINDQPYREVESEFMRTDNGAFVLSRTRMVDRRARSPEDRTLHDLVRVRASLVSIRLGEDPNPEVFTIAGLGLPKGARIQDRINGKEYLFGVSAVREEDIGRPSVSGPRGTRAVVLYTSIVLLVGLVGVLVWRIHRKWLAVR
jgi:hypothetical protein